MKNSSELSPNVDSLDIAFKSRAENLTKNSCYSPHQGPSSLAAYNILAVEVLRLLGLKSALA